MKIIKLSTMAAGVLAACVFAPQVTVAGDLQPGKGWDAFQANSGQPVSSDTYMGTAMGTAPGQGYDALQARSGAPVDIGSQDSAMDSAPSQGIDTFYAGSGRY